MTRNFFDPPWEQTHIVLVEGATLRKAERMVLSCEACNPHEAEIPFDWVLDRVTGCDPKTTDYVLAEAAKCPRCKRQVTEKTLIEWDVDDDP